MRNFIIHFMHTFWREPATTSEKVPLPITYNPRIHGTNSSIFALLDKTEFQLISSIDMLEKFLLAPMGGEITQGGLSTLLTRCNPCFGELMGHHYGLEAIIGYASTNLPSFAKDTENLEGYLDYVHQCNFNNLNPLLIMLARVIQSDCFTKEAHLKSIEVLKQLRGYLQYNYFLLLLGKYIDVDLGVINNLISSHPAAISQDPVFEHIRKHFNCEAISNKFCALDIDLKDSVNNPSEQTLKQIIDIFHIPANEKIGLPAFCPFKLKSQNDPKDGNLLLIIINKFWNECDGELLLDQMLYRYYLITNGHYSSLPPFDKNARFNYIQELEIRANIFDKLMKKDPIESKLSPQQLYFVQNPFPVILLCEKGEKFERLKAEYRSKDPLKIGRDIKTIAVDTEEHRLMTMKYFEQHGIANIQVILIDQLKQSKETQTMPVSPYTHKDGFPKLSWLAAKAAPSKSRLANTSSNWWYAWLRELVAKIVPSMRPRPNNDVRKPFEMLADAKTYDVIRLPPAYIEAQEQKGFKRKNMAKNVELLQGKTEEVISAIDKKIKRKKLS